jgi:hypothetical protein
VTGTHPFSFSFPQKFRVINGEFLGEWPSKGSVPGKFFLAISPSGSPHNYPMISIDLLIDLSKDLSRYLLIDISSVVDNDFIVFTQHSGYGYYSSLVLDPYGYLHNDII